MDTLRIISISLLAGCSAAGLVWYLWGMKTNIQAYKIQRSTAKTVSANNDTENDDGAEEPGA
ncbi:MAG: hypothetical protein COA73_00125 [Candidatus Hydrogenedentota bacterium]|nr:MAG: hypothetical protein COA73_00125 [Candidatus Hydrogenedentota bacterium]